MLFVCFFFFFFFLFFLKEFDLATEQHRTQRVAVEQEERRKTFKAETEEIQQVRADGYVCVSIFVSLFLTLCIFPAGHALCLVCLSDKGNVCGRITVTVS